MSGVPKSRSAAIDIHVRREFREYATGTLEFGAEKSGRSSAQQGA